MISIACLSILFGIVLAFMVYLHRSFDAERKRFLEALSKILSDDAAERRELYTRLQAWEYSSPEPTSQDRAGKGEEGRVRPSSPDPAGSEEERFTSAELLNMDIVENPDGGWVDLKSKACFETFEDLQEWRARVRKSGWPIAIHPGMVSELGVEAAVKAAKEGNGTVK